VFAVDSPGLGWDCKDLSVCANVLAPSNLRLWFLLGELMKKLVTMIFFAMLAGNAMAQAGGAASGAGSAGGSAAAGATVGMVATVAAAVAGVAAASANNSTSH
jgi:hypothetical protein